MANIIIAPGKYIQGQGELNNIGAYTRPLGENAFVLISKSGYQRVGGQVEESFRTAGCAVHFAYFNGECSKNEINRLKAQLDELGATVVVGIGGGKIHDTAKAVAHYAGKPVVIVPTIAGTDAPCSALSVIYSDEGVFEEYLWLPANPNVVLVDTDVVSKAPAVCWCPAWATPWPPTSRPRPLRTPTPPPAPAARSPTPPWCLPGPATTPCSPTA